MLLALLFACSRPEPPDHFGHVPAFSLIDQAGKAATLADWSDRAWVADFMFTSCPDVCPVLSARMAALAGKYATNDRVRFVSISVDPVGDTPEKLAAYAARFGADASRWRFLTGENGAIKTLVVDGFKQLLQDAPATATEPATVLHGSRFVLVDGKGEIRGFPDPNTPGEVEAQLDVLLAVGW